MFYLRHSHTHFLPSFLFTFFFERRESRRPAGRGMEGGRIETGGKRNDAIRELSRIIRGD
jgi:hypothetical protein